MVTPARFVHNNARREPSRRAFSLIELLAVITIIGLLGSMAFLRFGDAAFSTTSTDGFVRSLVLDLRQARRRSISTGDNHYVLLSRNSGVATGYTIYRSTGGGAIMVDRVVSVPDGVTVATASDQWEFEFDGSVGGGTGSGTIVVTGPRYIWTIIVYRATGAVKSTKVSI